MAEDQTANSDTGLDHPRKPTSPEGEGPLREGVNAATKHAAAEDGVTRRKREVIWPEVHDPFDTQTAEVDPRATGDPTGTKRDPRARAQEQ